MWFLAPDALDELLPMADEDMHFLVLWRRERGARRVPSRAARDSDRGGEERRIVLPWLLICLLCVDFGRSCRPV